GSATARLSPRRGWKRLLLTCLRVLGLTPPGYELSLLRSLRNCRARPDPRRAQYKGKPLYTPTGRRGGPRGAGKKSGLTVFSPVRMLQNGSTTRARQVLSIGTLIPLHRERVVSHHSVPSRLDGFFDAQDVDQAAHPNGNLPRSLRYGPVGDLVLLDVPALLLSRDVQPSPRAARDQGQAFSRPELATAQRYLQRALVGGGLLRSRGQRLAGRGSGHPFRRSVAARDP